MYFYAFTYLLMSEKAIYSLILRCLSVYGERPRTGFTDFNRPSIKEETGFIVFDQTAFKCILIAASPLIGVYTHFKS